MKKRIRRLLLSERGDSSYISSFVYILVVAIMIALIINVFHIISVKQEMDHISDQLVKQIQLNGGKSSDTDALFNYLAGELSEVSGLTYQVTSSDSTDRIQIGTPFYVSVTGRCYLGGFWKFNLVPINIRNDDVFRFKVRYLLDRRDPSAADPASDMRGINMGADQLVR